jgi:hypothetical protein
MKKICSTVSPTPSIKPPFELRAYTLPSRKLDVTFVHPKTQEKGVDLG